MQKTHLLNEAQIEAITHEEGPLLIIAGAGTGKTTVITERIKHLILKKNIPPSQILALTFTEKSSREMEERIDIAMPYGYTQMWISTFHAFCDRILKDEAIHIGLNPGYKLMTDSETVLFLRQNIFKFQLDYFRPLGNPNKFLEGLIQHFDRLRDEDISPSEYKKYFEGISNFQFPISNGKKTQEEIDESEIKKVKELTHAYQTYQDLKAKEGVMDFADLITNTLKLFRERKNILKMYQDQFKYILVDEFQDTNFAQNQLAILLSEKSKNITVVGDDDQAIYRWRGAAISNMIQFKTQFPNTKIITLTQNYRTSQEILNSAYRLIQYNNPDRLEIKEKVNKKLVATRKPKQIPIELLYEERVEDEADAVLKKIQEMVNKEKYVLKDIAILVRANDHAQAFVRAFERSGIPYQFLGPGRLFRQEEIKDLIAYLKVLYNFDDSQSLYRILNFDKFSLDPRDIAALLNFGKRKNLSLFEVLEKIEKTFPDSQEVHISEHSYDKIIQLLAMIKRHLKKVPNETAGQILYYFLEDTGILQQFLSPQTDKQVKQYQNIARFFDKLKSFEAEHEDARIFPVVEWIDLATQMGESPASSDIDWQDNNAVNILTIHSSKGLEFPVVFLVNLVNQRFPTRERREQIPIPQEIIKEILPVGDYHLQEERRLFYVGMTRARDRLYFTAANFYGEGKRERKLSPFVAEAIGEETVAGILKKQQVEKTVVQPSLLDWVERIQLKPTSIEESKDKRLMAPLTYVSYSQLQCFDMCPLHYKLQYVLRMPTKPSAALSFGTSVHSTLRDFYQLSLQGKTVSTNDIPVLLESTWIDEGYDSREHQKEAFERAKYIIHEYITKNFSATNGHSKPIAIEIPFQFFVRNGDIRPTGIKVGGRIDRVDKIDENTIEVIDYKTGKNMPTEKELETNFQLTVYALAATQVQDAIFKRAPENVILSLYYLEEGKKLTTTRTKEQLEEAKLTILQRVDTIEKSDFLCGHSIFCQNCEYKMLCNA